MFEASIDILIKNGENVITWVVRNSDHLHRVKGKIKAFFSGIYSLSMRNKMAQKLEAYQPDVVHAHNLYPMFSPSVLVACSQAKVPVVVHCHSYFLTCPVSFHLYKQKICERCTMGSAFNCVLQNCRGNILESFGYSLRHVIARRLRWFKRYATLLIVLSNFARERLIEAGYPDEKLIIIPNVVSEPEKISNCIDGQYIAYVGRLSPEKGVSILLEAARILPNLEFRIAGDGPMRTTLVRNAPANVRFEGWLDSEALSTFYGKARIAVVPSICYETFGLSAADAMAHGVPVVASRLGALPEVLGEQNSGLLFEPGNAYDLAEKIKTLYNAPDTIRDMGATAHEKAIVEYDSDVYYRKLMDCYRIAINKRRRKNG